jgi:glycosyltransferase involved in cell wall biosynthesis
MKIALVSDSPTLTTGFGLTTSHMAEALVESGYDVSCFGFKLIGNSFKKDQYPFKVWSVGTSWQDLVPEFLAYEHPDLVVLNMDIYNLREVATEFRQAGWMGKFGAYLVFDGLPAYQDYTSILEDVSGLVVSTSCAKDYLMSLGIEVVIVGPPGVDLETFRQLPNRDSLRASAGLADKFVIGMFGRNTERKQQPKLLQALSLLAQRKYGDDYIGYFHSSMNGYWRLGEIAQWLNVGHMVLQDEELVSEIAGVPLEKHMDTNRGTRTKQANFSSFSYIERLNCCDVVVNVPHSGDFEQVIIEAQACKVPIIHSDDSGIMAEALGQGGLLVSPHSMELGRIGETRVFVAPESIATAIERIRFDHKLQTHLASEGYLNATKHPWSRLRSATVQLVKEQTLYSER